MIGYVGVLVFANITLVCACVVLWHTVTVWHVCTVHVSDKHVMCILFYYLGNMLCIVYELWAKEPRMETYMYMYMYIVVAQQELGCMSCMGECIPILVVHYFVGCRYIYSQQIYVHVHIRRDK